MEWIERTDLLIPAEEEMRAPTEARDQPYLRFTLLGLVGILIGAMVARWLRKDGRLRRSRQVIRLHL